MKRKHRNAVHLTRHTLRYKASKWLKQNKNIAFNNPILTKALGLNPDSRIDTQRVYQDVIVYWRRKFIDFYYKQKKAGFLNEVDRYRAWDSMLYSYNQNDAYVFLYDRKVKCYLQPGFNELENMDKQRLERQWRGIGTVIEEMQLFDARLILPDGTRKPIGELLEAGRDVNRLLLEGE